MKDDSRSVDDHTPKSRPGEGAKALKNTKASGSRSSIKGIVPSSRHSFKASARSPGSKTLDSDRTSTSSKTPEGSKKTSDRASKKPKALDGPKNTSTGNTVKISPTEAVHHMPKADIERWESWASELEKSLRSGDTPPTAPIETLGLLGLHPRLRVAMQRGISALECLPSVMNREKQLLLEQRIRELEDGVRCTIVPLHEEYQRLHKLFIQSEQTRGQATLHMRDFHQLFYDYVSERLLTSDDFNEIPELAPGRRPLTHRQMSSPTPRSAPERKNTAREAEDSSEDITSKWEEWNRLASEMQSLRL